MEETEKKLRFIFDQAVESLKGSKLANANLISYGYQLLYWMILLIPAEIAGMAQRVSIGDNKGGLCLFAITAIHTFTLFKYFIPIVALKDSYMTGTHPDNLLCNEVFDNSFEQILFNLTENQSVYIAKERDRNERIAMLFSKGLQFFFIPLIVVVFGYLIYFIRTFCHCHF